MRRKLTTLKAKGGHSENGAPRALIELSVYREFHTAKPSPGAPLWDPNFSGWSNPSRPRDSAISLRNFNTNGPPRIIVD